MNKKSIKKHYLKSKTIIVNMLYSVAAFLPLCSDLLPILSNLDNKNYYTILSILITLSNVYLRTITNTSITIKKESE